jgi:peroxiredoxin Q/BCP
MLQPGDTPPDLTLLDHDGVATPLASPGQWQLIYFYPKDDTPGCTTQACDLRDGWANWSKLPCRVLGISIDSVASHQKFRTKYQLPFTLLADPDKQAVQAFGVWQEKSFMGRLGFGTVRSSFLIDPEGRIAKVYPKVKAAEHAAEVLKDLQALMA